MLVCFWSLKGGVGCSVTAALAALAAAGRSTDVGIAGAAGHANGAGRTAGAGAAALSGGGSGGRAAVGAGGVTLVDLDGEMAAVLGAAPTDGPGVADWLRAGADAPPEALRAVGRTIAPGLTLVGPGTGDMPAADPTDRQLDALDDGTGLVVIDAGCVFRPDAVGALARVFAAHATRSVLVTRPCYLALRRAAAAPVVPSAVVVLAEAGRALGRREIEEVIGAPVAAWLAVDPAVARAVDAGLLATRVPRGLVRALEAVA